jgi:hypothetical protein
MKAKAEKKAEKKLLKKEAKAARKGALSKEEGYMSHSHYFKTLADPFSYHGEKIPDPICYPSSTFSITDRRVLTLTSNGGGTVIYGNVGNTSVPSGSLIPIQWAAASVGGQSYCIGGMTTGLGVFSGGNIIPTAVGEWIANTFPNWNTSNPQVQGLYQKARLVSAGVCIDYLGTALNAKGRLTMASVPRATLREKMIAGSISILDIQNLVGAKIIPINKLVGGSETYHPLDLKSFEYVDLDMIGDNSSDYNLPAFEAALGGEMFIVIDGAEAAATCQVTAVFNYEGIPRLNTLNLVQPGPSRDDPIELSMAKNAITKVPTTFVGSEASASRPLMSGKTQISPPAVSSGTTFTPTQEQREEEEEESFMTSILDSAEDMLSSAPGIIGKAAPLARKALGFLGV